MQIRPDCPEVLYNLGLLLANEQRPADGVVCLQQAVRLTPDNPEAHNNLGLAYAELGRFEDAVASCGEPLRLRPQDPKAHMNRYCEEQVKAGKIGKPERFPLWKLLSVCTFRCVLNGRCGRGCVQK